MKVIEIFIKQQGFAAKIEGMKSTNFDSFLAKMSKNIVLADFMMIGDL